MRPILYEQNERVFDTNGMGVLHDAISAEVTEVRNAEFELELKYPVGGEWAQALTQNRYILVKPNDYDEPHAFRIYEIEKEVDSNQITVKGVTKTDELSGNVIKPLSIKSAIPSAAWEQLKRVAVDPIDYNFISDIQTSKDTTMDIRNVLNAVAGEEGSFIDTWGGEIKRTNNTIFLYSKRGRDHVTTIRPRKNLKNVKIKSSMAGKFTRILPYTIFKPEGEGEAEQIIYGDIIKSPHYDDYFIKRIVPLDLSSEFNDSESPKEGEKKKAPTPAQVTAKAQSYFTSKNKDADKPDLSVEVEMIPLQDSTEWDRRIIQALEKIQLCDTVDVYVPKIDCDVTVKVRKIVYDALRERIIKIEASSSGSGRASLADQQKAQWQDLTNKVINNALYGEKDGLINTILTAANNKNKNFYGPDEPPREKVSKDDLWFKTVGAEGQVEMWRFDGENWVLIVDANFEQKVTDKVNDAIESAKRDINADVQTHINEAIADAEKRWKPDLTPMQNELDAKLRKLDDDINVKVTDIQSQLSNEINNITIVNPNLIKGTVDMSAIPESTVGDDNNWRRMDGIGGKYQEMSLGGYRYTGSNQNNGYKRRIVGSYPAGYFKKGKYVWSFYVKTDTPGFVLQTYCDPKVNKVHDIRLDDVSVGAFRNNEFSFRFQDTEEHIISYHFEVVDESKPVSLGLLRYERDTVGATIDTYKWKIEDGTKRTPWCPNFQDPSPEWSTYKQTNDSNLAELNKRVTDANGVTELLKTRIDQTSNAIALKADKQAVNNLTGEVNNAKAELSLIPGKISTAISQYKSTVDGQISRVSTSIDQKTNEIKIAAQNLEKKVDGNATNTAAELKVIKDSISAKVSRTDLDTVSGKVTDVETNLSARIDGIQTSVNNVTRDVDGKITSAVSSAITQSEQGLISRINSVNALAQHDIGKIKNTLLPEAVDSAKQYTDTTFSQVDGKIQTQINARLSDYARTSDVATRVTQEAGRIKTELTSVIENKLPKKYGSRNLLSGTSNPVTFSQDLRNRYLKDGEYILWNIVNGYNFISGKTLKELGFKVGDRINVQYKVKVKTPNITRMRLIPELYTNTAYIQGCASVNGLGLPSDHNMSNFDISTSEEYRQKVTFFNINQNTLTDGIRIIFRHDTIGVNLGTTIEAEIKDVMMWAGDLWTDYAPAQDDIDPTKNEKFQEVLQTVDVYKRTLGTTQNGITTSISQLIQTSDEIRTVITNAADANTNLIMDTDTFASVKLRNFNSGVDGYLASNTPGNFGSNNQYYLSKYTFPGDGSPKEIYASLPLAIDKMYVNETYTISFKYSFNTYGAYSNPNAFAAVELINSSGSSIISIPINPPNNTTTNNTVTKTFTSSSQHSFDNLNGDGNDLAFRIKLRGVGRFGISDVMMVKGSTAGKYRPASGASSAVVTQRSDAWALTLKGPKDVITSINADTSGVRLKGKNIVLDGDVIANGTAFIKESWIQDLNAAKITSGQINAANIDVINLNASNIVSGEMSAARIRGGILSSLNGDVKFDLNGSKLNFFNEGEVYFDKGTNILYRQRQFKDQANGHNAIGYLMFKNSVHGGVATLLGSVSHRTVGQLKTGSDDGGGAGNFAGIRIFRDLADGHYDRVEVVADRIQFRHSVRNGSGLQIFPVGFIPPTHNEPHYGGWNLGILLEHFRQNFEKIRKKNPSWGMHQYEYPIYNLRDIDHQGLHNIPFNDYV